VYRDGDIVVGVALTWRRDSTMSVKITARPNGPYVVEGECEIYDPTGARIDTPGQPRIALCRCGGSTTKPRCDGTHSKIGFQAAEAAVKSS
jgi:CDGSH-type Zn-finger protein